MKIRAVRLREVGPFQGGVALEGLSGGLDVLPGPNEAGKSTIFRAIETVFQTAHSSVSQSIKDLAPAAGGAPLIEVEFEAQGARWRIRKQYLSAKAAELTEVASGRLLRGADAEARLAEIVAGTLDRRHVLPMLWVDQMSGLELPKDKGELAGGLGRLIEAEIADAAGGVVFRQLRAAIADALGSHLTPATAKPAAGSAYKAALDQRDRAAAAVAKAEADVATARRRLADLAAARARAETLSDPAVTSAREARLASLRKALSESEVARVSLREAGSIAQARQAEAEQASAALASLEGAVIEAERLRASLATIATELTSAAAEVSEAEAARDGARASLAEARERLAEARRALEAHDRAAQRRLAAEATATLEQRLTTARSIAARLAEASACAHDIRIEPSALDALRRMAADVARLDAAAAAMRPAVRVDYHAGGERRLRANGAIVALSGEIDAADRLVLEIEGVGRVTVTAPAFAAADGGETPAEAQSRLAARLTALGVASLDEAEQQAAEQAREAGEARLLAQQLASVAPAGIAALQRDAEAALVRLSALAGGDGDGAGRLRADIEVEVSALVASIGRLEATERAATDAVQQAGARFARLAAARDGESSQLAQIDKRLPHATDADAEIDVALRRKAECEAARDAAILERRAWEQRTLAPAAHASLAAEIAAAELEARRAATEQQQVQLEIRGLEGALERDRQDGVESVLAEAEVQLAAALRRVDGYAAEIGELRLLARLMDDEAQATRSLELKPVVDRLQCYAARIFPEAAFELGDKLVVSGLVRAGTKETVRQLSVGTLEQIVVLVRLAYARLLADRGEDLPVVLDDALVYADPARFAAMIAVLADAARHHQVVMLTCHTERLAALGDIVGLNRLALRPWESARTG